MLARFSPWYGAIFLSLALAAGLVYAHTLGNAFLTWDDEELITGNPIVATFSHASIRAAFTSYDPELYIPLTFVSYQIEHALFGFRPAIFHFTNLLLHVIASFLVFLFLKRLRIDPLAALLCTLLFAVHPLNTEAVAWASARKDLLCAVFSLAALLAFLRWRGEGARPWFRLAAVFLLLALLSKPTAIVLPFVFLLLDWYEGRRIEWRRLREYVPFLLLGAVFLLIGILGKTRNLSGLTLWQTLLLAAKSTVLSSSLFLWPRFSLLFLQATPIRLSAPDFFVPFLLLAAVVALAAWSLRRTRVLAFALGFALLLLLPSFANFAKAGHVYVTSDRYLYLAQIGFLFLIGTFLTRFLCRSKPVFLSLVGASIIILLFAGGAAYRRGFLWRDSRTLFEAALARNPGSAVLVHNLGFLDERDGNVTKAIARYEEALQMDPKLAKAHFNLGVIAQGRGMVDRALEEYRAAVAADPLYAEAWNNIGSVLRDRGDLDGALAAFRSAVDAKPSFAQAHINLAEVLGKKGMYQEGLDEYRKAMALDPAFRNVILKKFPELGGM